MISFLPSHIFRVPTVPTGEIVISDDEMYIEDRNNEVRSSSPAPTVSFFNPDEFLTLPAGEEENNSDGDRFERPIEVRNIEIVLKIVIIKY